MKKIPRSSLRAWCIGVLKTKQGGVCSLCLKPINIKVMGNKSDYVADHDHETGEIRGVLHRSCNTAEGKVVNAAGAWGAKSMKYADIIPFLKQLILYLEQPGHGVMYPEHKSAEEKAVIAKQKAKRASALSRARAKIRKERESL